MDFMYGIKCERCKKKTMFGNSSKMICQSCGYVMKNTNGIKYSSKDALYSVTEKTDSNTGLTYNSVNSVNSTSNGQSSSYYGYISDPSANQMYYQNGYIANNINQSYAQNGNLGNGNYPVTGNVQPYYQQNSNNSIVGDNQSYQQNMYYNQSYSQNYNSYGNDNYSEITNSQQYVDEEFISYKRRANNILIVIIIAAVIALSYFVYESIWGESLYEDAFETAFIIYLMITGVVNLMWKKTGVISSMFASILSAGFNVVMNGILGAFAAVLGGPLGVMLFAVEFVLYAVIAIGLAILLFIFIAIGAFAMPFEYGYCLSQVEKRG